MPYCPRCGSEYRSEVTVCADCGVALVAQAPKASRDESLETVELYACASMLEGEQLKATLGEKGLLCRLRSVDSSSFPGAGGDVRLVVPVAEALEARAIVDACRKGGAISKKGEFLGEFARAK